MNQQYIERVIDLTDPAVNRVYNMSIEEARRRVRSMSAAAVREIDGSFALIAREGKTVRMARSLDRPMRYFLAKRQEGPALIVADRIDAIAACLKSEGLADQFHPGYTRMVPAHHIVEIQLIGCPDPDPSYTRFFEPRRNSLPEDANQIGRLYIEALAGEIAKWLQSIPSHEPIGVCFSGGIDSGAVFLVTYHCMARLGMNLSRLKAFTLCAGDGPDARQARHFLEQLGLGLFLEQIDVGTDALDPDQAIGAIEDYKPLDVQCATMGLALCRGLRQRYPQWRYLIDGDGGDENLKDYPIEENPELTIRSVVNNPMLYQEGWGVGKIKHSLTYSGGLSRSYTRTYAPSRRYGFEGFSPFTRPGVIEISEAIPFVKMTSYETGRLYEMKGTIVAAGVRAVTGMDMPVFTKRRFQHGVLSERSMRQRLPGIESDYRRKFLSIYV
jgi:asparagine synthase (glutamine-hydrolysing)